MFCLPLSSPTPSSQRSSGAHVNPQVSVAFALTGDLAPLSLPAYLLGQFLGAGAAAALVLVLYLDVLTPAALAAMASSPGVTQSTFPLVSVASWTFDSPPILQIVDQVVASCLLQLVNACVKEQVTILDNGNIQSWEPGLNVEKF